MTTPTPKLAGLPAICAGLHPPPLISSVMAEATDRFTLIVGVKPNLVENLCKRGQKPT